MRRRAAPPGAGGAGGAAASRRAGPWLLRPVVRAARQRRRGQVRGDLQGRGADHPHAQDRAGQAQGDRGEGGGLTAAAFTFARTRVSIFERANDPDLAERGPGGPGPRRPGWSPLQPGLGVAAPGHASTISTPSAGPMTREGAGAPGATPGSARTPPLGWVGATPPAATGHPPGLALLIRWCAADGRAPPARRPPIAEVAELADAPA
jgi:hypothetical protein